MENDKQNFWNYKFTFQQTWPQKEEPVDWTTNLDETELELLFLSAMSDELTETECSEAREMLSDIGIKC